MKRKLKYVGYPPNEFDFFFPFELLDQSTRYTLRQCVVQANSTLNFKAGLDVQKKKNLLPYNASVFICNINLGLPVDLSTSIW